MEITVNGQSECSGAATVLELLVERENRPERVVVELNGEIVPSGQFAATSIAAGDRLEIVQFVGGG